jgi:hypothetical protein
MYLVAPFLQQLSLCSPPGAVYGGEGIKRLFANQPGIMNFGSRQIALATQPFYRLRMNFQTATGLYYGKVVV